MVQARSQGFLREGDIQRVDGPNDANDANDAQVSGEGGRRLPETAFGAF